MQLFPCAADLLRCTLFLPGLGSLAMVTFGELPEEADSWVEGRTNEEDSAGWAECMTQQQICL